MGNQMGDFDRAASHFRAEAERAPAAQRDLLAAVERLRTHVPRFSDEAARVAPPTNDLAAARGREDGRRGARPRAREPLPNPRAGEPLALADLTRDGEGRVRNAAHLLVAHGDTAARHGGGRAE